MGFLPESRPVPKSEIIRNFVLKRDGVVRPKVGTDIHFPGGAFPKKEKSLITLSGGRFFEQNDHLPFFYLYYIVKVKKS